MLHEDGRSVLVAPEGDARAVSAILEDGIARLGELLRGLPGHSLPAGERQRLAGELLPLGVGLVDNVARTLSERPQLFPDAGVTGDEMREGQARAWNFRALYLFFQGAAECFLDSFVVEQVAVNRQALHVIDLVERVAERPELSPHLDVRARGAAMLPALVLMEHVRAGKRGGRRPVKKAAGELTPRQLRAREETKARRRGALFAMFDEVIREGHGGGIAAPGGGETGGGSTDSSSASASASSSANPAERASASSPTSASASPNPSTSPDPSASSSANASSSASARDAASASSSASARDAASASPPANSPGDSSAGDTQRAPVIVAASAAPAADPHFSVPPDSPPGAVPVDVAHQGLVMSISSLLLRWGQWLTGIRLHQGFARSNRS